MRLSIAVALVAAACVLACAVRLGAHDRISTTVTWDRDIAPIVAARCLTCHERGGRAPMSLATYEAARPWARAIRHEVLTRAMPKWHAARGFGDFANDPSLSPFEISLIVAWVDGGAPRSLPARALAPPKVAPPTPTPWQPPSASQPRRVTLPCGRQTAPPGRLVGLRPKLDEGAWARVVAALPDGQRQILGWFRDYEAAFAPIYWLRRPADLTAGTSITTESSGADCVLELLFD
jgi:hypothetical protein